MNSNIRYHLMTLLLLISIVFHLSAFAKAPISSIGSSTDFDRVSKLERISNAHSQLLTQLQQQLIDNQNDIDILRGKLQESQYQLNQLAECQKKILFRINGNTSEQITRNNKNNDNDTKSNLVEDASSYKKETDVKTDYNEAFALLKDKSRQNDAIVAFQKFIKKHSNSTYQPNANYWLGQLNYNKGNQDTAAFYFATVVKNYPSSIKAPDAMFKVGIIMQNKKDTKKAKAIYKQVIARYPESDAAKQAKKYLYSIK